MSFCRKRLQQTRLPLLLLNLSDIRLPRELEADDSATAIRRILSARTTTLWPGGNQEVPVISMTDPLEQALVNARLKEQIRCGFDAIVEKLRSEKKGIMNVRAQRCALYGNRVSRLILLSNDGAERLYRHIERLLQDHSPRVLACLLDIDNSILGRLLLIAGKDRQIKVVMAEHKAAVSDLLRAILNCASANQKPSSSGGDWLS
jgi:hypothetical protein